uniref:Uncharacterized protein n=1 Tax=Lepeophtheirus salmonis TaxID=72036 RepID=A0A0K2UWM1_LEPSM
MKLHDSQVQVD